MEDRAEKGRQRRQEAGARQGDSGGDIDLSHLSSLISILYSTQQHCHEGSKYGMGMPAWRRHGTRRFGGMVHVPFYRRTGHAAHAFILDGGQWQAGWKEGPSPAWSVAWHTADKQNKALHLHTCHHTIPPHHYHLPTYHPTRHGMYAWLLGGFSHLCLPYLCFIACLYALWATDTVPPGKRREWIPTPAVAEAYPACH